MSKEPIDYGALDPQQRLDVARGVKPQASAAQSAPDELWAVHAQGPDDLYAAFSRDDAEKHAAGLNAMPVPEGIRVSAVVIPSPWPAAEHWQCLAEQEREHCTQLSAAWQRAQSAPVVPEGWRLVPAEPTPEMQKAGWDCLREKNDIQTRLGNSLVGVESPIYRAMLAAAPQPAAPVAECTNEDSWNCKYCRKTETCAALKDERNFGAPPKAARQEQVDGMCNADEPSNRCICREEFGYKACGPRGTEVHQLRQALEHARLFIRNGIDLGYIRMPDADTPDPAHETLPMIDGALSASAEGKA